MDHIIYFAYGSNMSHHRLQRRVPSAKFLGIGILHGYTLVFHKVSKDGSAKCDVVFSENAETYGVLFSILGTELPILNAYEGNGKGYKQRRVKIRTFDGQYVEALTYVATEIDPKLPVYTWYKRHVLEGARQAKLPPEYLQLIERIEAIEDPETARTLRELDIYK